MLAEFAVDLVNRFGEIMPPLKFSVVKHSLGEVFRAHESGQNYAGAFILDSLSEYFFERLQHPFLKLKIYARFAPHWLGKLHPPDIEKLVLAGRKSKQEYTQSEKDKIA